MPEIDYLHQIQCAENYLSRIAVKAEEFGKNIRSQKSSEIAREIESLLTVLNTFLPRLKDIYQISGVTKLYPEIEGKKALLEGCLTNDELCQDVEMHARTAKTIVEQAAIGLSALDSKKQKFLNERQQVFCQDETAERIKATYLSGKNQMKQTPDGSMGK